MIRFPLSADENAAVAYAVRILSALSAANGNHEAAAEALKMSRRTLDDHIVRLGMRDLVSALWDRSARQPRKA